MKNNKLIIGSHVSLKAPNYLVGSVNESIEANANSFMVYTGPNQSSKRMDTKLFKIKEAFELMKENNINPENVLVHASYLINLASNKETTREFGCSFLIQEIQRTSEMGFKYIVLHPGSKLDNSLEQGIKYISDNLNYVFEKTKSLDVVLLIETMSGKGSEVGSSIHEIKEIIDNINLKEKVGVCLDTCHLNDSGYDIDFFDDFLDEFDKLIGIDKIKAVHLNDSKNVLNARKDRHENIGYGTIKFESLQNVVHNERLTNIPMILETPYVEKNKKYFSPYKQEIEMLKNKKFDKWIEKIPE